MTCTPNPLRGSLLSVHTKHFKLNKPLALERRDGWLRECTEIYSIHTCISEQCYITVCSPVLPCLHVPPKEINKIQQALRLVRPVKWPHWLASCGALLIVTQQQCTNGCMYTCSKSNSLLQIFFKLENFFSFLLPSKLTFWWPQKHPPQWITFLSLPSHQQNLIETWITFKHYELEVAISSEPPRSVTSFWAK